MDIHDYNENVILVCCHKEDFAISHKPYLPIHVGRAIAGKVIPETIGDDTGVNISQKNKSYCELTGLYWAWKNLDSEIVGLCHYRRYFDFHNQCRLFMSYDCFPPNTAESLNFDIPASVIERISSGKIVAPKKYYLKTSLKEDYFTYHYAKDYNILRDVVMSRKDIYSDAFDHVMEKSNGLRPYNMFIMNRNNLDEFCQWLFSVLKEVENAVDISSYDQYQGRIFGFMAERLFNVWFYVHQDKIIEKPVIIINDGRPSRKSVMLDLIKGKLKKLKI